MTAIFDDLLAAADDLDRLEELDPRPGRVGLSNRLRRAVREADDIWWCETHEAANNIRTAEDLWACNRWWLSRSRGIVRSPCRMVRRPLLKPDAADT